MIRKTNKVQIAIRLALLAGMSSSPAALAQESGSVELEAVTVTGSRIARPEVESTQPVLVVDREDLDATGQNNLFDILNSLSVSDGSGLSTVTTQTNGSDGSQQISLRGFGANRTLVLVDGKRWATDVDATTDLSTIPLAIIERVEVLKDGASAIYGSDAIGGVINLITRRDFDGASVNLYVGETAKGDGKRESADLTVGASSDKASGVISISYTSQEEIFAGNRKISSWPYYGCEEMRSNPSYTNLSTPAGALGQFCGSGFPDYGRFTVSNSPTGVNGSLTLNPGQDGQDATDFIPFTNLNRYNFAPVNYLQQPAKRGNVFGYGRYDLSDSVSAFVRASYTKRTSSQQLAQVPLTMATNGSQGPQWTIPIDDENVFNPFGVDINSSGFRMVAAGPRSPSYDYDVLSTQAGLDGKFEMGDRSFSWEVFGQYNDGQYDSKGTGYINLFNMRNALGPSFRDAEGVLRCGSPGNVIRNCVPFNVFGGPDLGVGAGVITQQEYDEMVNYVSYTQVGTSGNSSTLFGGTLSGELFELPGGTVAFAIGFESRKDDIFVQPDTLVASGGSSDNFSEPTKGEVTIDEFFGELVVPLISDAPFAKELEISLAARTSDYSASGLSGLTRVEPDLGSPTTEKFGLRWRPFEDLLVRASWGETFRAPSVNDLFGGGRESFPVAADPCRTANWGLLSPEAQGRCVAAGVPAGGVADTRTQLRALLGGNPFSLQPETGENYSIGMVYRPSFVEGLDITVDYWNIKLEEAISTFGATTILNGCYTSGTQPDFCDFVERAPGGLIATVRTAGFNVSEIVSDGIDVGIYYRLQTENLGGFQFKLDWTHTLSSEVNGQDFVGLYTGSPNWENRANLQTNWQYGDFSAVWTVRYTSNLEEDCWIYCYVFKYGQPDSFDFLDEVNNTGDTFYHDLQISYQTPWKGRVTVGGRNIFGEDPPILDYDSFAHSFDAAYDLPGGAYWYVSYRQDF